QVADPPDMAVPPIKPPVIRVSASRTVILAASNVGVPLNQVFRYLPDIPFISTPPAPEIGAAKTMFSFGARISLAPEFTLTLEVEAIVPLDA
ncbi:MAG: hypothetical protein RJA13_1342, partial [Bacteroidota bacterium]